MNSPSEDLTLVTVNYHSWPYLKLLALTAERLCDDGWAEWLLLDNTEGEEQRDLLEALPGSRVLNQERRVKWLSEAPQLPGGHTQDHASALNALYREVDTKWTLITDPDVAFLAEGWDEQLLRYAEKSGLDAIGAPYHPRKWQKFRGYPCVIFLLVRTELLRENDFDFRSYSLNPLSRLWEWGLHHVQHKVKLLFPEILQGFSQDTGWRLQRLFEGPEVETETFDIPFIRDPETYYHGALKRIQPNTIYERPHDQLFGEADLIGTEFEEFWWNDQLFATHHVASVHGPNSGWTSEKSQAWAQSIFDYLDLEPETHERYLGGTGK